MQGRQDCSAKFSIAYSTKIAGIFFLVHHSVPLYTSVGADVLPVREGWGTWEADLNASEAHASPPLLEHSRDWLIPTLPTCTCTLTLLGSPQEETSFNLDLMQVQAITVFPRFVDVQKL